MNPPDFWITLKLHSAIICSISFVLYLIFAFLTNIFLSDEERTSLLNGEEKLLRFHVMCFILNAVIFRSVALVTGATFIAAYVKDYL